MKLIIWKQKDFVWKSIWFLVKTSHNTVSKSNSIMDKIQIAVEKLILWGNTYESTDLTLWTSQNNDRSQQDTILIIELTSLNDTIALNET